MRQFTHFKRFGLSLLFITVLAFVVTSCQSQEGPLEEETPQVQAAHGGAYGSCGSCPLPSGMSGTLPALLYPSSVWMINVKDCFEEDLSDVGAKCKYRTTGNHTISENISVYIPFSGCTGNCTVNFCSFFYQLGNQLEDARPSGNYLLESINNMVHLTGSDYWVNVTWRAYMCEAMHVPRFE